MLVPTLKVVLVRFDFADKKYAYYTDIELEKGDLVVAPCRSEFKLGEVRQTEGLSVKNIDTAQKMIVQKVDFENYESRVEALTAIKETRLLMKQRREQLDEMLIYEQLAKNDPEMRKLVNKMNSLAPGTVPSLESPVKS